MTGDVLLGIVDKTPVEGIHLLLGNDVAGGKVNMCPRLCEKHVIEEKCTLSVDYSQLYPECVVTRPMAKKAKQELHSDVTGLHSDINGDTILSETVYNDWCESPSVENPTTTPCVLPKFVKGVDLKLSNGREELIEAQKVRHISD